MKSISNQSENLRKALEPLQLPEDACRFIVKLWEVYQGLDDWYDNEEISNEDKLKVIHSVLVDIPSNPFFHGFSYRLSPVIETSILKWVFANTVESSKNKEQYDKAYVHRAGFYDIILEVVSIVHGFEAAASASTYVLSLYGETLEDYKKEFEYA